VLPNSLNNVKSNVWMSVMRINILSLHTKQLRIMDHRPLNGKHFTVNFIEFRIWKSIWADVSLKLIDDIFPPKRYVFSFSQRLFWILLSRGYMLSSMEYRLSDYFKLKFLFRTELFVSGRWINSNVKPSKFFTVWN
jgi:hypothetical protein